MPIGDSNLKNAAVATLHSSFANFKDVGDHCRWLTKWDLADWS
jgi:hypothetical protein